MNAERRSRKRKLPPQLSHEVVTDPNYLIPILKMQEHGYPGSPAKHYSEAKAGRLILTKMGRNTFAKRKNADAWRDALPEVDHAGLNTALKVAEQKLTELAQAVAEGQLDRAFAIAHLAEITRKTGLVEPAA